MDCRFFSAAFAVAVLAWTNSAFADLRDDLHAASKAAHRPIGYGQTDEAMKDIYRDPAAPSNILLFYTGRSQHADLWVSGDSQNGWNREHVWPQSRGVGSFPMKSDLHNLKPTDASVNQRRGNLNFDVGGNPEGEAPGTFLDGDSFEPRDDVKGDVARALFYMDVRYAGTNGEPDLELVDDVTTTGGHTIGDLCTILAWHEADPPDMAEIENNDDIATVQGNRNPFVDDPTLGVRVFGSACGVEPGGPTTNALRVGTWNIANLHHESGVPLRNGAAVRDDIDFERLAGVADTLDLDITALQEVGSPRAVQRVFPESDYHVVMSGRYKQGAEDGTERDIYTALVFAKDRFPTAPTTTTLDALSIPHIGFDRDGTPTIRATRAGIVAEIEIAGQMVRLLGVHMKSSCHRWSLNPVVDQSPTNGRPFDSRFHCRTLAAQAAVLESWIEQQAAQGIPTVVLGDFNREMNATNDQQQPADDLWLDLNDGTPNGLALRKGPEGRDDICWPNHSSRFDEHIDFVVYDAQLNDMVVVRAPKKVSMGFEQDDRYDGRDRQRLSDHCPVTVLMEW